MHHLILLRRAVERALDFPVVRIALSVEQPSTAKNFGQFRDSGTGLKLRLGA